MRWTINIQLGGNYIPAISFDQREAATVPWLYKSIVAQWQDDPRRRIVGTPFVTDQNGNRVEPFIEKPIQLADCQ